MKNYRFWILGLSFLLIGMTTTASAQTGSLSGLVFYDYTMNDDANAIDGFGISRAYFTYQNKLSDHLKYKFQTDIDYGHSPMNVYLKAAQMDWSSPIGKISLGLQGLNIFSVQEKTWGLRYLEKSPMDQYKWASSADMGIGYANTFAKQLHLSVMVINGAGYKSAETDSYKRETLQLVWGEGNLASKSGFNVGGIVTYEPFDVVVDSITTTKQTKTLVGGFGGLSTDKFRAGAEFERLVNSGSDKTGQILSVYGNFHLLANVELFGRYDSYDPDVAADKDGKSYIILGASYSPAKGLTIAPNFRYVDYQDGTTATKLYKINFEIKG